MAYMRLVIGYLARLTTGRIVLWCYAIWYVVNVAWHFDPRPGLWVTSLGLSAIIGLALLISTRNSAQGRTELDRWQIFRLFLMPFCVSSFAALVKGKGYILVFPPDAGQNLIGFLWVAGFLLLVLLLKKASKQPRRA